MKLQGILRRQNLVKRLKKEPCTALELAEYTDAQYKSILDDIHAIRHNRSGLRLIKKDEVLIGIPHAKRKVFMICKKKDKKAKEAYIIKNFCQVD